MTGAELRAAIEVEARALGFGALRVAGVEPLDMERYDAFLARGWHGEMAWLAASRDDRADARRVLAGARSAVVLAVDYGHPAPPDPGGLTGRVARYAWGRDYHNVVGKRLRRLQRRLRGVAPGLATYASLDNRPVFERAWAARAGLGYSARNGCAIDPGRTSYFFLAVLLVDAELPVDVPLGDHCGKCRRCVDACPTAAIGADGGLDARRCISYLSIEHDSEIPPELRPALGRWLFGCDDCQDPCPHVRVTTADPAFAPVNAWVDLPAVLAASDEELRARFLGTPLYRAAGPRLRRNAAVVLGNLGDRAALPALERAWKHDGSEVVRRHAAWGIERLG